MSKNTVTIEQIKIACRQVDELIAAGMTENLAIRNLELFANCYAKLRLVGNVSPDRPEQFRLWSKAALELRENSTQPLTGRELRCEHGTPRRQFARLVLQRSKVDALNEQWLNELCDQRWKVAVITCEEDQRLNKSARSTLSDRPEDRWASVGIEF